MNATTASPTGYAALNAILDQARRPHGPAIQITDDQLRALQARWVARLTARLDQAIEQAGPFLLAAEASEVWQRLAAEEPTLRAVLDRDLTRTRALADVRRAEYRALALAAGLAGVQDPEPAAAELGRRLLGNTTAPTARRAA